MNLSYIKFNYLMGIIFSPVLFLAIAHPETTYVGITIGRILLLYSVILLLIFIYLKNEYLYYNKSDYIYFLFICYVVFSFIVRLFLKPEIDITYLRRSIVEIGSLMMQFITYIFLPRYLYQRKNDYMILMYFFFIFSTVFLVIGYIELISKFVFQVPFIPRHFYEFEPVYVPDRLISVWGEPRDLFVYLSFILCLINLNIKLFKKNYILLTIFIFISMLLTRSFSGLISLSIFLFTLPLILNIKIKFILCLYSLFICIIYMILYFDERSNNYLIGIINIIELSNYQVPKILSEQSNNIFPVFKMISDIQAGNYISLIFGFGVGGSGLINTFNPDIFSFNNPHSMFIKYFLDFGIFGAMIFYYYCFYIIRKIVHIIDNLYFTLSFIFLFICCLIHKSDLFFILIGICTSYIKIYSIKNEKI